MPHRRAHRRTSQEGAVLITVMLVMLALLGLGVMALWMTGGNLQIGANTNLRNQALYVAEAGIEAVRNDLNGPTARTVTGATGLLAGGKDITNDNVPTGAGVDAAGLPNGVGAVYYFGESAPFTPLTNIPFPPASFQRGTTGTASTTMGTYTVWIRNDTADLRRGNIITDSNNTIVVRSRGVAPDGRTQVVLEVTMAPGSTPGSPSANRPGNVTNLCNSGKNACDENSSTQSGIVVQ